jgi:hypothetical protein
VPIGINDPDGALDTTAAVRASKALSVAIAPAGFHDDAGAALGMYVASHLSGTMAAALGADSEILQVRWVDATRRGVINRVRLDGVCGSATAFTAGFGKVDMLVARAWTADGSGGSALTLSGNNQKARTSFGAAASAGLTIRGATTAALGAGTKTLDANPVGLVPLAIGTVASVQYATAIDLFNASFHGHPLVLENEEGFVVRATVPATGTWQFGITVEWARTHSY